tara:strand:+ start:6354 stop:6617 length:264 start_codon:yes stop_codon:yes gene_type:complete
MNADLAFYHGEGCAECNGSGHKGPMGLYEMLDVTPAIKSLINKRSSTQDIEVVAKSQGMFTLRELGIEKVLEGETTLEQLPARSISH